MSNTRAARIVFLVLFIISIVVPLFYFDQLPERIASHFNTRNQADSWMSKGSYMIFHYSVILFFFLLFWGLSFFVPRFPPSLINLPNKEYWLSETRKEKTFLKLQAMMFWIGNACLALFIYVFYELLNANINGTGQISSFSWVSILIFLSANTFIVIKYVLYFTKKENQSGE
ncbi:MAG: hypothetical protein A2499_10430 [Stygiobacter sp. RIFOXYC12_FULL_38_8]|nr:MAG: hypothetical protein A2279_04875 [Stygiobacter sp. RIFOXYA12_FULL_38_9]OGV08557.1 MAG: hypothetical protein A2299_16925 [Stygiobacter sp. RIFOXYB2_FULL_37_11]OGV10007.1 MAG: hypothetical protein A2237_13835 [Stygiobacter sp. RIFOXYA2_FULL_38_8]OGV12556.1 MAG: hypothetical protein A2440_15010 [Stygiobacter sp. RIFOXYC2_FULL_38_25]OGV30030.1 MAG: hypothetical protein A2499_10430 [Stygiobacter sp. RIFOXYC12_FULL_38_8]OGV78821.1 MAG: hypothetical protein A2X65_09185 [Stygiobacter sp. GWF2_